MLPKIRIEYFVWRLSVLALNVLQIFLQIQCCELISMLLELPLNETLLEILCLAPHATLLSMKTLGESSLIVLVSRI
jgi:hypothetical protein